MTSLKPGPTPDSASRTTPGTNDPDGSAPDGSRAVPCRTAPPRRPEKLGRAGEDLAHTYVCQLGWHVLERNWRCRDGEIDLIALDGDTVVFVEVKTRHSDSSGHPLEAVTRTKLRTIHTVARTWLASSGTWYPRCRVDVIGILWSPDVIHLHHAQEPL